MSDSNEGRQDSDIRRHMKTWSHSRMFELGPQVLSDVELVAMLLAVAPDECAQAKAAALLARFGTLRTLLIAHRESTRATGMSDQSHAQLQAALELARRHYQELMTVGTALSNPKATREFLRAKLRDLPHEIFAVVYLDNRNRVVRYSELFRGTIDGASVHAREVVKEALAHNAAAVILAHNHPSGIAEPSQADELITRKLKHALALVDIRVVDHLIVGDGVIESFAERGLL